MSFFPQKLCPSYTLELKVYFFYEMIVMRHDKLKSFKLYNNKYYMGSVSEKTDVWK